MIKKVNIKNFKSLEDFSIDLGRLNIIIGANGSGKTNILEAIVMGAAASSDKLDYEFLGNRIRVTSPEFMKSAFTKKQNNNISLNFLSNNTNYFYELLNDKNNNKKWIDENKLKYRTELNSLIDEYNNTFESDFHKQKKFPDYILKHDELFHKINLSSKELSDFIIYTPELSFLRKFEEPSQITPLGIKGEGLFYTLKQILSNKKNKTQINDIKESLHLLDWFEDFNIPENLMFNEFKIQIKDKFVNSDLNYFDQKSANEGFLYLLFYLVLFTSKNTPTFFAIDNIEAGFNPKFCTELVKILAKLAKKYKKQVIFTTHNPAILDGLDLKDKNQRLFIANRDKKGKTYTERIEHKPQSKMRLSELWTRGYIGGIPDNF